MGIGLAMSKAVISLAGIDGQSHPKVYGRCVYKASKLASGVNELIVDEDLDAVWPTIEGGALKFEAVLKGDVRGFRVTSK
jgi:hypothetical protein